MEVRGNVSRFVLVGAAALVMAAHVPASAQRAPIAQQLVFTPYHASGIYEVGETVGWTVTPGAGPPAYAYEWTIRRNNAVVLEEGRLDLSSGSTSIEIVADQPSMLYVAVEADAPGPPAATPAATPASMP